MGLQAFNTTKTDEYILRGGYDEVCAYGSEYSDWGRLFLISRNSAAEEGSHRKSQWSTVIPL